MNDIICSELSRSETVQPLKNDQRLAILASFSTSADIEIGTTGWLDSFITMFCEFLK